MTAIPTTIPHGRTAQRLTWPHLPPAVRALVEEHCGSPVVDAVSQGGGFTPGFASVLTCADGTRHFVKAASAKAQRMFAESYREEARKLQRTARRRARPPTAVGRGRRLGRARDSSTSRGARRGGRGGRPTSTPGWTPSRWWPASSRPVPDGSTWTPSPTSWRPGRRTGSTSPPPGRTSTTSTRPPTWPPGSPRSTAGDTVVHMDVRDDNMLVRPDGTRGLLRLELADRRRRLAGLAVPAHRPAGRRARHRRRAGVATADSATCRPSTSTACWPW